MKSYVQKKFLLVLDDVWNESSKKWFELRNILLDMQNDSKIIVTTRSRKVVSIMGTVPELNLEELLEEECMKLFVKCAFQAGEEKKHPRLIKIGKEIVKKLQRSAISSGNFRLLTLLRTQ